MKKQLLKLTTLSTLVAFIATQVFLPTPRAMAANESLPTSFQISPQLEFGIPADLGTIESYHMGQGPAVIHIQTAHGNYEAQKNIQAILHHLKEQYGIKTLFVEGSDSQLRPELFRLFPEDMDLTMAIADELTEAALVKGAELYLLEDAQAEAYGIEQADIYRANGKVFKAVLRQQQKTENFIREMNQQIIRLTSPYLNKDLRAFLDRLKNYEEKKVPFLEWLDTVALKGKEVLEVDLKDPAYQIRFPHLTRVFEIQRLESQMNAAQFSKQRSAFLNSIKRYLPLDIFEPIKQLLENPMRRHPLPDPETGQLFQAMVANTPQNFNFDRYPMVKAFMARLILQSEIKAHALMAELDAITDQISLNLAHSEKEKEMLRLLKDHRLLQKLFKLELTPREYEKVLARGSEMTPHRIAHRFLELNRKGRVRNTPFQQLEAISVLHEQALEFYRLVKKRDEVMTQNVADLMKKKNVNKAVVITGGFHSEPFGRFFSERNYRYALISPKITTTDGREAYVESLLQKKRPLLMEATFDSVPVYFHVAPVLKNLGWLRSDRQYAAARALEATHKTANRMDRPSTALSRLRESRFAMNHAGVIPFGLYERLRFSNSNSESRTDPTEAELLALTLDEIVAQGKLTQNEAKIIQKRRRAILEQDGEVVMNWLGQIVTVGGKKGTIRDFLEAIFALNLGAPSEPKVEAPKPEVEVPKPRKKKKKPPVRKKRRVEPTTPQEDPGTIKKRQKPPLKPNKRTRSSSNASSLKTALLFGVGLFLGLVAVIAAILMVSQTNRSDLPANVDRDPLIAGKDSTPPKDKFQKDKKTPKKDKKNKDKGRKDRGSPKKDRGAPKKDKGAPKKDKTTPKKDKGSVKPPVTPPIKPGKVDHKAIDSYVKREVAPRLGKIFYNGGVHAPTGAPKDHLVFSRDGKISKKDADYGSPAKEGTFLPLLVNVVKGHPLMEGSGIKKADALSVIVRNLESLRELQLKEGKLTLTGHDKKRYNEVYAGFFSWNEFGNDGKRRMTHYGADKRYMIPILDNGQLRRALKIVYGAFEDAGAGSDEAKARDLAKTILQAQDYSKFIDPVTGNFYPEWVFKPGGGGRLSGNVRDSRLGTEHAIAAYDAYIEGSALIAKGGKGNIKKGKLLQRPWKNINNDTFVFAGPSGPIDVLQCSNFSCHEMLWLALYSAEDIRASGLAPLFDNFVYLHAKGARDQGRPGFNATTYGQYPKYHQSGLSLSGVRTLGDAGRSDMSAFYGTAKATLIRPGARNWLFYYLKQPDILKDQGIGGSFSRQEGASNVFDGDAWGGALAILEEHNIRNNRPGVNDWGAAYDKSVLGMSRNELVEAFNLQAKDIRADLAKDLQRLKLLREAGRAKDAGKILSVSDPKHFSLPLKLHFGKGPVVPPKKPSIEAEVSVSGRLVRGKNERDKKDQEVGLHKAFQGSDRVFFKEIDKQTKRESKINPKNNRQGLSNGSLKTTVDENGVLSVPKGAGWAGEGSISVRLPGKKKGYKYAYFWVRSSAGKASFDLKLPGFRKKDEEIHVVVDSKEWKLVEIEITENTDALYYFSVSKTGDAAPFQIAGFHVSKTKKQTQKMGHLNVKPKMGYHALEAYIRLAHRIMRGDFNLVGMPFDVITERKIDYINAVDEAARIHENEQAFLRELVMARTEARGSETLEDVKRNYDLIVEKVTMPRGYLQMLPSDLDELNDWLDEMMRVVANPEHEDQDKALEIYLSLFKLSPNFEKKQRLRDNDTGQYTTLYERAAAIFINGPELPFKVYFEHRSPESFLSMIEEEDADAAEKRAMNAEKMLARLSDLLKDLTLPTEAAKAITTALIANQRFFDVGTERRRTMKQSVMSGWYERLTKGSDESKALSVAALDSALDLALNPDPRILAEGLGSVFIGYLEGLADSGSEEAKLILARLKAYRESRGNSESRISEPVSLNQASARTEARSQNAMVEARQVYRLVEQDFENPGAIDPESKSNRGNLKRRLNFILSVAADPDHPENNDALKLYLSLFQWKPDVNFAEQYELLFRTAAEAFAKSLPSVGKGRVPLSQDDDEDSVDAIKKATRAQTMLEALVREVRNGVAFSPESIQQISIALLKERSRFARGTIQRMALNQALIEAWNLWLSSSLKESQRPSAEAIIAAITLSGADGLAFVDYLEGLTTPELWNEASGSKQRVVKSVLTQIDAAAIRSESRSNEDLATRTFENVVRALNNPLTRESAIRRLALRKDRRADAVQALIKAIEADSDSQKPDFAIAEALAQLEGTLVLTHRLYGETSETRKLTLLHAIGLIGPEAVEYRDNLGALSVKERSLSEIEEFVRTLGKLGRTTSVESDQEVALFLQGQLKSGFPDIREAAAIAIRPFIELVPQDEIAKTLTDSLVSESSASLPSEVAAETLLLLPPHFVVPYIQGLFGSNGNLEEAHLTKAFQTRTATLIGLLQNRPLASALLVVQSNVQQGLLQAVILGAIDAPEVRVASLRALPIVTNNGNIGETLQTLSLNIESPTIAKEAIETLGAFGASALPIVERLIEQGLSQYPEATSQALLDIGREVIPVLVKHLKPHQAQPETFIPLLNILASFKDEDLQVYQNQISILLSEIFGSRQPLLQENRDAELRGIDLLTRLKVPQGLLQVVLSLSSSPESQQLALGRLLSDTFEPGDLQSLNQREVIGLLYRNDRLRDDVIKLIHKIGTSIIPSLRRELGVVDSDTQKKVPLVLEALSGFKGNLEAEEAIGFILNGSDRTLLPAAARALDTISRTEARAQEIREVERLGALTAFVLLSLAMKLKKQKQLQKLIETILGISIAYALVTDVQYNEVQAQIGAAPYALTPEFQAASAQLQIPTAKPDQIVEAGFGTKLVEKEFLDILRQSPAALRDQLEEFQAQRLADQSSRPTAVVFVEAGQAETFRDELIAALSHAEAGLPVQEDRIALAKELEIVELAKDQTEAQAMQAKAGELNNAAIILGVGRKQVPGVYKMGVAREELRRASKHLGGIATVFTRFGGRAAIIGAGQESFEVRAGKITEFLVKMLAEGERTGSGIFYEAVAKLALEAHAARYIETRA